MRKIKSVRNHILKNDKKSKILTILSILMTCISIFLGFMIYAKKDENGAFLKENFGVSYNFKTFNSKVNSIVDNLFDFNLSSKENDKQVSTNVMYIELENNMFSSESSNVEMLNKGMIIGVFKEEYTYSVLVNYDNGVIASYSNLVDVCVKQYDSLDKGDTFGYYEESFKALFKKNDKIITYNEAL